MLKRFINIAMITMVLMVFCNFISSRAVAASNDLETTTTTNKGIYLTQSNNNTASLDIFRVTVNNTTGTWYVLSTDPESMVNLSDTPLVFVLGPYQGKVFDVKLSPGQKIGWHAISPVGAYYAMSQNPYPTSRETAIAAFGILSIDLIARGLFIVELPADFIHDTNTFFNIIDDVVDVLEVPALNLIVELFDQITSQKYNLLSTTIWKFIFSLKSVKDIGGQSFEGVFTDLFGSDIGAAVSAKFKGLESLMDIADVPEKAALLWTLTADTVKAPGDDYVGMKWPGAPPDEDIQLEKYSVGVRTGDTETVTISSSGYFMVTSSDSQVATADVDDDKINISGVSAGNATVTVTSSYGETTDLSVMVVKDFPALGTWDWDLASGEACYFNENKVYCNMVLDTDVEDFWTAESSSQSAFQTLTNQLCQAVLHDEDKIITSGYAYDTGYFNEIGKYHSGIDIDASVNEFVYSPIKGEVYDKVSDKDQANRLLIKEENSSRIWILGHMTPFDKWKKGETVNEDDILGNIHSYSNGDHLHLEVLKKSGDWYWTDDQQQILDDTVSPMQAYFEYLFGTSSSPETDPGSGPVSGKCGAYVAPGVWKEFDCYNLAAIGKTTNDDPFTPSWRLIGGYWQWGRKGPSSSQWYDTNTANFAHGPTGPGSSEANSGSISGWDSSYAPDGSWSDASKTANDPCPTGFRVPTITQWEGVRDNNTQSPVGTWAQDDTNYSSARFFGNDLMLPAAGYRYGYSGSLSNRGYDGNYWSSTESSSLSSNAWYLYFNSSHANTNYNYRRDGFSVRCIAE